MGKYSADNFVQGNYGGKVLSGQGKAAVDPKLQDAMAAYSSGKMSLADAIKSTQSQAMDGNNPLVQKRNSVTKAIKDLENAQGNGAFDHNKGTFQSQDDSLRAQEKEMNDQITAA